MNGGQLLGTRMDVCKTAKRTLPTARGDMFAESDQGCSQFSRGYFLAKALQAKRIFDLRLLPRSKDAGRGIFSHKLDGGKAVGFLNVKLGDDG